jgi:hypothetical protein
LRNIIKNSKKPEITKTKNPISPANAQTILEYNQLIFAHHWNVALFAPATKCRPLIAEKVLTFVFASISNQRLHVCESTNKCLLEGDVAFIERSS